MIDDPQSVSNWCARIGDATTRSSGAERLQQDLLVGLTRRVPKGWTVPEGGIEYACEICGERHRLHRKRKPLIRRVDWGSEVLRRDEIVNAEDRELKRMSVWPELRRVLHYFLICPNCRPETGAVRRCGHEEPLPSNGRRVRCGQIVSVRLVRGGPVYYCAEHRSAWARRRRDRGTARQAPDLLWAPDQRARARELAEQGQKIVDVDNVGGEVDADGPLQFTR